MSDKPLDISTLEPGETQTITLPPTRRTPRERHITLTALAGGHRPHG